MNRENWIALEKNIPAGFKSSFKIPSNIDSPRCKPPHNAHILPCLLSYLVSLRLNLRRDLRFWNHFQPRRQNVRGTRLIASHWKGRQLFIATWQNYWNLLGFGWNLFFEKAAKAFNPITISLSFLYIEPWALNFEFWAYLWGRNGFDGDKEAQAAYRASCLLVNPVGSKHNRRRLCLRCSCIDTVLPGYSREPGKGVDERDSWSCMSVTGNAKF